jgi:hypothetical protein
VDPGSVILLVLLGVLVVGAGTAITLSVLLYKALRRLARRPVPGAVRRSILRARATAGSASGREIAGLRLQLQDSVAATRRSLEVARESRQHIGRLDPIVQSLSHAADVVDRQLAVAQKDPDPAIRRVYTETLGVQVEQILSTSTGVRTALARSAQPLAVVGLSELTQRLDVEAAMLANWSATFTRLQRPGHQEGAA